MDDLHDKLKIMAALPGEAEPRQVERIITAFGALSVGELNEMAFQRQQKLREEGKLVGPCYSPDGSVVI